MTSISIPRLNFIGCGKAGRVLGKLWHQAGVFTLGEVCTRSLESAQIAVGAMGAGTAVSNLEAMQPADMYLVAVPDRSISTSASQLAKMGILRQDNIVFHLSGALTSARLKQAGINAIIASVHPLLSFADVKTTVESFSDIWCGFEGQPQAYTLLAHAFEAISGRVFQIQPDKKLVYHAACVMVSNYVNALVESSQQCFELAGIDRELSSELLKPILLHTCKSISDHGASTALTGPIARGDSEIVEQELELLNALDSSLGKIYQSMGLAALTLAKRKNNLSSDEHNALEKVLNGLT